MPANKPKVPAEVGEGGGGVGGGPGKEKGPPSDTSPGDTPSGEKPKTTKMNPAVPKIPTSLADQQKISKDVQRALLRDAMQSNGSGKIAHHIIPLQAESEFNELLQKAAKGGFNINGASNGILLDEANYIEGHPDYNKVMFHALNEIPTNLNPQETAKLVQKVADTMRKAIQDRAFGPWGRANDGNNPARQALS